MSKPPRHAASRPRPAGIAGVRRRSVSEAALEAGRRAQDQRREGSAAAAAAAICSEETQFVMCVSVCVCVCVCVFVPFVSIHARSCAFTLQNTCIYWKSLKLVVYVCICVEEGMRTWDVNG